MGPQEGGNARPKVGNTANGRNEGGKGRAGGERDGSGRRQIEDGRWGNGKWTGRFCGTTKIKPVSTSGKFYLTEIGRRFNMGRGWERKGTAVCTTSRCPAAYNFPQTGNDYNKYLKVGCPAGRSRWTVALELQGQGHFTLPKHVLMCINSMW